MTGTTISNDMIAARALIQLSERPIRPSMSVISRSPSCPGGQKKRKWEEGGGKVTLSDGRGGKLRRCKYEHRIPGS
jgi:hypothetical protein